MQNRVNKFIKFTSFALLICIAIAGFLFLNNDIGVQRSKIESDIRLGQKIDPDWTVNGTVSDTMAAFISYPDDKTDHTFSIYVNRPGLSFGYFFRGGGDLIAQNKGIAEYTVEGYNERAFISMNKQQVECLKINDGNSIRTIDIDSGKPFTVVLPLNAGEIAFYDVDGNTVEFYEHRL